MELDLKKIIIIGNGISGITCARHIRKRNSKVEITIISGETEHFFSRTALMYIYMGHMKYEHTKPYEDWFWEKNRLKLKSAWVQSIDFEEKELVYSNGETESYDLLVLATGSKPNKFGWKGQDLEGVQGLYSYQDLQLMEKNTRDISRAVIVGGGLIGIEMAEMLLSRKIPVTFLVREKNFWDNILPEQESEMINRHILEHHIDLRLSTLLEEIKGDGWGRVSSVLTQSGEEIPCQFVGLTAGVSPNIEFLKKSALETNRGVVIDEFFQTNIPDVYAIGDCAEFKKQPGLGRNNIEQVWYTGRMQGETLAYNLTSTPVPYQPGVWFNSAKFLDIEYQTYGTVPPNWEEKLDSFYWEDRDGRKCLRILYEKESGEIKGVNAFGWRLRHDFFDRAITENWSLIKVMSSIQKASFNPEFFKANFREIIYQFNRENGSAVRVGNPSFFERLIGSLS